MLNIETIHSNITKTQEHLIDVNFKPNNATLPINGGNITVLDKFVFAYGPYIATNRNEFKWLADKLGAFNPYMALMNMGAEILQVLCSPMRIGDLKVHLVNLTRQIHRNPVAPADVQDIASNLCNMIIDNIRTYQKQTLAMESTTLVVTEKNPSVLNIGTKIPNQDALLPRFYKNMIMDMEESFTNQGYQTACAEILKDFLLPILMCASSYTLDSEISDIEDSLGSLVRSDDFLNPLSPLFNSGEINTPAGPMVQAYYFMAGLQYVVKGCNEVLRFLETMIQASEALTSSAFESAITNLAQYIPPDETFLSGDAEQELRDASDEKILKVLEGTPKLFISRIDRSMDIDKITAYLFNHRNMHCNALTNTLFLGENSMNLDSYSFINDDILIAKIKENFALVCPFNDMVDDRKPKLLIYWMQSGEIAIKDGLKF